MEHDGVHALLRAAVEMEAQYSAAFLSGTAARGSGRE